VSFFVLEVEMKVDEFFGSDPWLNASDFPESRVLTIKDVIYLRNPVQRGQRFHGKGDSNPVKADSR
jgi:hypothetical protein